MGIYFLQNEFNFVFLTQVKVDQNHNEFWYNWVEKFTTENPTTTKYFSFLMSVNYVFCPAFSRIGKETDWPLKKTPLSRINLKSCYHWVECERAMKSQIYTHIHELCMAERAVYWRAKAGSGWYNSNLAGHNYSLATMIEVMPYNCVHELWQPSYSTILNFDYLYPTRRYSPLHRTPYDRITFGYFICLYLY